MSCEGECRAQNDDAEFHVGMDVIDSATVEEQ